jgi:hypothetical protein
MWGGLVSGTRHGETREKGKRRPVRGDNEAPDLRDRPSKVFFKAPNMGLEAVCNLV